MKESIEQRVHHSYWDKDLNCATTMLMILADLFRIDLEAQVIHSAIGMHGAGGYGAQCGLVEGSLMFMGILGKAKGLPDREIISMCKQFAAAFESSFGSLGCAVLRPAGFAPDNPPHLCEELTRRAVAFSYDFLGGAQNGQSHP
jgi:Putative redox-active protein (C_GCAxxG_C_C)